MTNTYKRIALFTWILIIGVFAVLHGLHLRADFPNYSPWITDWAKYTDEGWYGNAAIRAHLFGYWYRPGDFNPAPVVPVWPFLEWVLFFITGVTIQAARGLAVAFFFVNLLLSYLLLKDRGPRWMALLGVTMIATSPFLYSFSRLAILEPMLIALSLAALNLAIRLPRLRRPVVVSAVIGLLCTLMMLTKTTAVFLLPALGWAIILPLRANRKLALRCSLAVALAFAASSGLWMAFILHAALLPDFRYFLEANTYPRPSGYLWPFLALLIVVFRGMKWIDLILIPLIGMIGTALFVARGEAWVRKLLLDPLFGASFLAMAGYAVFMVYQCHAQPRYFSVMAFFCFFLVAQGTHAIIDMGGQLRSVGVVLLSLALGAIFFNVLQTLDYVTHPEFTFVDATARLTEYIDAHPNGNRLVLAEDSDQITLATGLPSLCEQFATPSQRFPDTMSRVEYYQPGWYLTLSTVRRNILESLHTRYSLEQVGVWPAFDSPDGGKMVLFKLHPLPANERRDPARQNLQIRLPEDRIEVPIQ